MSLRICILADPLTGLNLAGDSSIALAEAALARGHEVSFTTPKQLWRRDDKVFVRAERASAIAQETFEPISNDVRELDITKFDVVLMRKDPPFDVSYVLCLQLLDSISDRTLTLASPVGLMRFSEKLMTPELVSLGPPTLVSQDSDRILAFLEEHGDIVLKPLYRGGGSGIVRLTADGMTAPSIIHLYLDELREPVTVQKFLPAVFEGDKRVVLMGDQIVGAFNRRASATDFRSNLAVGGGAEPAELSSQERAICEKVLPVMEQHGVVFAGLDLIGGLLTEVNVTSPTGIRQVQQLSGVDAAAVHWDIVEAKLSA